MALSRRKQLVKLCWLKYAEASSHAVANCDQWLQERGHGVQGELRRPGIATALSSSTPGGDSQAN
eukprot:CAMPEP_0117471754 /NCGR_PEP_ID=MMETSP0784-20121206/7893_1 /TAXON_ID=39447 /ORGANISM="" /LENGTH=64 /DNA_ID=CAMNT_0005265881 /DNA_START=1305 /DNA_END=1499 /DNA_ORIENTATION=-